MIDTLWVLICCLLVLFMQSGFICLESGIAHSKNSINIATKNITDVGVTLTIFWIFGYAIMFGPSHLGLMGHGSFITDLSDQQPKTVSFFLFQALL